MKFTKEHNQLIFRPNCESINYECVQFNSTQFFVQKELKLRKMIFEQKDQIGHGY